MTKITIKVGDKDIELTLDEARHLFNELSGVFGEQRPSTKVQSVESHLFPASHYFLPSNPRWVG